MLQKHGSFDKRACLHCWLPPQEDSSLCRQCSQRFQETPTEKSQVEWIRYHSSNPIDCRKYRGLLKEKRIHTHVIPEECLYCCSHLLKNPSDSVPHLAILQTLKSNSCAHWTRRFIPWLSQNRDELLEFVAIALELLYDQQQTCLKLVTALLNCVETPAKKKWILEELVLRPSALPHILHSNLRIPPHISHDFWGHMCEFEEYWPFWESMIPAAKRRLRFRCLRYKEELMATTWHPDRFLAWCSDVEERQEVFSMWEIRI